MSKTNGTQGARVCVHQLAVIGWLAGSPDPSLVDGDVVFAAYLRSQDQPQTYRYLRRWLADGWGDTELVSPSELRDSLHEERILGDLKGKNLDSITELVTRAQGAKRDLAKAFAAYEELLTNGKKTEPARSSGLPRTGSEVVRPSRKGNGSQSPVGRQGSVDGAGA